MLGAATWPTALLVWAAHTTGLLPDPLTTALTFTWLMALGCVGAPVAGLRILGARLTKAACAALAAACGSISALLTTLYATGALHPAPTTLYASLIAAMAPAVHAYNIARWNDQQRAIRQDGVREGRAMEAQEGDVREQIIRDLVNGKNAAELRAWIEILRDVLAGVEATERGETPQPPPATGYPPRLVRPDDRATGHG